MVRWMIVICIVSSITLSGCTRDGPKNPNTNLVSSSKAGKAAAPSQIDGTIKAIQTEGEQTYVILSEVTETGGKIEKVEDEIHKSEEKVILPHGHFSSANHWQSDGDTLDLFIGDRMIMYKETGKMIDISSGDQFAGIVKSINEKEMVIEKVLYNSNGTMKYTDEQVPIHIAPYTIVSLYGLKRSQISVGDAVVLVLIGPPTDNIATQITSFSSINDAGWHME